MSHLRKKKFLAGGVISSLIWDVSTQGRYSELFLLNRLLKVLFIPDVPNLKVKQKTGPIPQSHIKKTPAATNQNVEATYFFKFGQ